MESTIRGCPCLDESDSSYPAAFSGRPELCSRWRWRLSVFQGAGVYFDGSSDSLPRVVNCTIADNAAYGGQAPWIYPATIKSTFGGWSSTTDPEVRFSIVLGPITGIPRLSCSDLDEWNANIISQLGSNGNFSANPQFCSNYQLYSTSPCAPENSPCGELVGSEPVGCILGCGNVNSDAVGIDILDLVYLTDYCFRHGPAPLEPAFADLDGSGDINIADITYLVKYLYRSGPAPVCQ